MNMPRWITIAFTLVSTAALSARGQDASSTLPRDYKGNLVNYEPDKTFKRDGRAEMFVLVEGSDKDHTPGSINAAQTATIDPYIGGGVGFGGNVNDFINVNLSISGGPGHFDIFDATTGNTLNSVNGRYIRADANVEVYPLRWRVSPLFGAGVGVMNIRGNDAASPFTGEWSETNLTYNLTAGVRWNIDDHLFIKGFYRATWMRITGGDEPLHLDGVVVQLGWTF